ncbi:uncharacterized protein LOC123718416 isoform X1 [Pieris brassicae]|uniref:uncharacterized protein LOC123718416 isoform X1 n=1 Tax=Pieris brassicae TaxID=7116 RepID=UPI001E661FDE|nr:uncharacterized protein LOC123718416 isoform X1 [Pieris brassicae]
MEAPAFPRTGVQTTRAAPGSEACIALPLPIGTPPFTYEWNRAGATLDDRFRTSVDASGIRLTVSSAQIGDSGVYTLQASNAAGKDTTRVSLEVSLDETPTGDDPPTFLRRLQDLTVKVGTRTRFLVEILSSTECRVTWYRNERRLLEAERIALVRDGNFWCADVATVSVDDAGRWTCTAENLGGRASCSAHLNVLVPKAYKRPEFVEELRAILTEQGTVSLECKVVGVPTPVLRWFKDSREIKAGDVFALTANADDPTSLGTYTCEAINCMGRAYSSSKVHVIGRSKEGSDKPSFGGLTPDPPPIFTKELEDQFVRICDHLSLGCQIVVPPWPRSVVWYNKEGKVDSSTQYHIIEDGVGGYMIEVSASEWADEGEWKCVATSAGGRIGISTCNVTMDVPKNYRKPRFMENLQAILTEEGLVSFECKVVGFPTPILSWFKDGQELKPGDVYQLTGTNSLGSYCCIARNCMGQASSSAELTVEDIQNQLNEEEKLQLFSKNQAPKFLQGLKSVEVKIDEPFRFTIKVVIPPEPTVLWYRDDQPMDESPRCHLGKEDRGVFYLDIKNLELMDQTEWKCVAMNDYGHSVTSCFLKLIIPRHYKKPRFLENLQAILSDEGAVNLECKVIGVPQPVLKWYKDGEELKPGDIHRIISGQDGTCCLGTYTCEAQNCMGIAASSASLLGFEDTVKAKKKRADDQILQRNLSLSTIHEERTSQMYDTPVADVTLDEKGEISFSFDGKEVSVSLYETPDLTEEEALQIVEMYADQLSENVTEHNVIELPPLRFVKETSTSGNLLMEAIIIDVSPDYFVPPEEDLRTEADIEDISIAEENGQQQLSFDQEVAEEYIDKTMALLTDEKSDIVLKPVRRKSDSQKSGEDYFSLSRDQSLSEEKKDDDTQILSESITFASAHSTGKQKSKPSQEDDVGTQESSDITKTVFLREELPTSLDIENKTSKLLNSAKRDSLKSITSFKQEEVDITNLNENMIFISLSLSKILNKVQMLERDIILQSQLMPTAAIAAKSLEIINSIISPLTEIHNITDAFKESMNETSDSKSILLTQLPQCLKDLQNALAMVEKCVDVGSDKTLINNTCISIINNCEEDLTKFVEKIRELPVKYSYLIDETVSTDIKLLANDILNIIDISKSTVTNKSKISQETQKHELSIDKQHLNNTQKAIYHLKVPLNSLWDIIENALKKSLLSYNETNNAEAILFNMSSSIQDLQTALEQIEFLSVEESNSSLPKYNTTTIETVISSVLKLRNSFESLSFEKENKYDKEQLGSVLQVIKVDLEDISFRINDIEKTIGSFDVLYGDNKLEILQKMAHVLIALENSLPVLSSVPNVQETVSIFHKNLTKALENAIESNDRAKYSALLHICDVVSRINVSIQGFESSKFISLTSILNNFNIIEENLKSLSIDQGIRDDILKNVYQCYVDIQNVITTYEEDMSIKMDSEPVKEIATDQFYTESKVHLVVQQIDQLISAINNISAEEVTPSICCILPILQNTCPVLEELKCSIASLEENIQENSHVSDAISQSLLAESIGAPLQSIQENITVLNQVLLETVGQMKSKDDAIGVFAKPLYELYTTLQTLQENVLSEYESFSLHESSAKIATSTGVLRNCILIVEEQCYIEGLDEMSTLQDISCLKTTADPISESNLILPVIQETHLEAPIFNTLKSRPEIAHEFQLLHEDILEIQKLDILEALNTLSEVKEYANIKSVTETIEEIQHKIVSILSPLVMESLSSVSNLDLASNNLTNISESLFKLKNHLTVIDVDNIPIYEDVLKIPSNKIHSIVKNISNLKEHLDKCLLSVQRHTNLLDSEEIKDLYYVCNDFVSCSKTTVHTWPSQNKNMYNLVSAVENFLQVIKTTPDLNAEEVKSVFNDLYKSIINMEDTLFEYVSSTEIAVTKENPLETIIHKLASNIAVLEHYNADLSSASNTDFPQSASLTSIETEYLNNMENVIVNNVIIMQNLTNPSQKTESQKKDTILIQNFMEKFKSSFSIIRVLLTQRPSHKRVIRLFQEYFTLQINIYKFKKVKSTHTHPEDFMYLHDFLNQAEGSLEKIKLSLIKLCSSISKTLFREPLTKINDSIANFPNYLRLDSVMDLHDLIQNFLISVNIAAPHLESLEQNVVQELETCIFINSDAENKLITDSLDNLLSLLEREMCDNPDNEKEKLLKDLVKCFRDHQDYKNAIGTGKRMIILKCLADCSDILRNHFRTFDTEIKLLESTNGDQLQELLNKFIHQLKSIHFQINEIKENVFVEPDLMIKNIISLKQFCEKHLSYFSQSSLCEDDFSIINDIINEIHLIQDNINRLQNDLKIFEDLKDIDDFFKKMLSSDKVIKDQKLSKAVTKSILQHVEQYIEITEIIEEISAIINLGNVKKTKEIAQELRESLTADNAQSMDASEELKYCPVSENQENLAQRLQISLSNIRESELLSCDTHVRKHILDVVTKLQDDLNTITSTEKLARSANMNNISQDPGIETYEKSSHNIDLLSISNDQECTAQDLSIKKHHEKTNAVPVIHQIEDTIACISGIIVEEISSNIKNIYPVMENICPILEELKLNVAMLQENIERTESPISDISDSPVQKAFTKPLRDLEENIIVLNHLILESLKGTTENENLQTLGVLAKPLHELHITYQILQENVISQYESLSFLQPNINFAATEQILHSCVLLVQEPHEVEFADEMSTLEDISCIKTTADSISSDVLAVAQDMQVTPEEYYTSHKQKETELDELATQQVQTQTIMKENISVSIEQPLKLEHEISQETIVFIDEENKTKEKTMTEQDALKKIQVSTEESIRKGEELEQIDVREIQVDLEKCIETSKSNISSTDDDQFKSEQTIVQNTIDENIKKTETNLTEIIEVCVESKNDSDLKVQVPTQECLETTEENISVLIDETFVLEQAAAQDTQITLEKCIETSKTNITSSHDDQLQSEQTIEQDTIDANIKKMETSLTEITEECVELKNASDLKVLVPTEECLETTQENISVLIDPSLVLEHAGAQDTKITLEKCIKTSKTNIISSHDDQLKFQQTIEQDTIDANIKKMETNLTEIIEECVEPKNDSDPKVQVPTQESLETTQENISILIDPSLVLEQAAAQETQNTLEKCIETSKTNITSSHDDQLHSEQTFEQDTIDANIKKTETNYTETIEEYVESKNDSDLKVQVPTQESLETTEENISVLIDQTFVLEQAAAQETQITLEKCIDTSKTNITSSHDDQLKSEQTIEQYTIDANIKKTETNLTETIEECVEPKNDSDLKVQVPTQESLETTEENISVLIDQTFVLEQAAAQETQITVEKCIETSKTNITSSHDDQLQSEQTIEQDTIHADIKKTETNLSEITEECVEPKNDSDLKVQVPTQECLETTEENISVLIDQPFILEQAAAQETQITLGKCIETNITNITSSHDDQLHSEQTIEQDTIDANIKKTETEIFEESVKPKNDSDLKVQVPAQECLETTEENISVLIDQPFILEQAAAQETQNTLKKCIETSKTNITSSHDVESEQTIEKDTIDENIKKTKTNLTEIIEECVEPKNDSDLKVQVPTHECLETTEENISVLIDETFVLEQVAAQDTQITLEKCIETSKTNITSSHDDQLKFEQTIEQDTIDANIKKMETNLTEIIEECVEPKNDSDPKVQVPTQESLETTEKNISVLIDQPFILEQAAAQETQNTLEKCIETSKTNITSSHDDQLHSEQTIEQDTIDANIKKTETNYTETIEEYVESKNDSDLKVQVPTQESLETTEENISVLIDQTFVLEQAAAQETQVTLEKCIETSKTNITSSHDGQLKSEQTIAQDTIDANIKKTETNLTETIEECVEPKNDSDLKVQVPTQESLETTEENISVLIDQTFVLEQAAAQETQITVEKCIETSKTNITSSHDDQLKSEQTIAQDTIDANIKKTETNLTETIEECVEPKNDSDLKVQVPTQESLETTEENISVLIDQTFVLEQAAAQETQITVEKCIETSKTNITSSHDDQLKSGPTIEQDTIDANIKKTETNLTETIDEYVEPKNDSDLKVQVPTQEYLETTEENIYTNYNLKHSNIMQTMDSLLKELHEILISGSATNVEKTDSLQNMLEEFQVQIIKLKSMNIKYAGDTLNETIDDLECSVRSVQLLINESSPTDHVIEASSSIELLVNTIREEISKMHLQDTTLGKHDILEECISDTETTLLLLDKVSETTTNRDDILKIINDLNTVKDSIKTIKLSFSIDEETVIERGIEILQSLDIIEQQLFTIEDRIEKMPSVDALTRDTIITAVHSVYTNISNIRGTISNIKKSYIYQNYGKPSENLLKAIKNINHIKSIDNNHNWISVTKHCRNILNHFEEIKFYINLDKTARQPSDASLTKVVLNELKLLLSNVVLTNMKEFQSLLRNSVDTVIEYIEECIHNIDSVPVLEVREKIPIFKELTRRLIYSTNEILEKYAHVNTLSVDTNANEPEFNGISTSESQYASDKTIILESHKPDCMEVTVVQPVSALNNFVSHIITESSFSKDDIPPNTEIQTGKYNNIEKQLIKDGVQPIIEHLIEEAIDKVTLLRIENGNTQEFGNEEDIKKYPRSQNTELKCLDETKVSKNKQEITSSHILNVSLGINEDLKKDKDNQSNQQHEASKETFDGNCKNIQENSLILKRSGNEELKSSHSDSQIQDSLIETRTTKKLDSEAKSLTEKELCTVHCYDKNGELISPTINSTNNMKEKEKNTILDKVSFDKHKMNDLEKSCTEIGKNDSSLLGVLHGKLEVVENINSEMECKENQINTETTRNSAEISTQELGISNIGIEKVLNVDITTEENNEIVDNQSLQDKDILHPQLNKDCIPNELECNSKALNEVSKSLVNQTNFDFDENLVIEEGKRRIRKNETLNEVNNRNELQNDIKTRPLKLNLQGQQLLTMENLNYSKGEIMISNVELEILQATASEQNITDIQKDFKNITLSTNLVDRNDVLVIQDQNTSKEHVQSIERDKQESFLEMNTISQNDKQNLLSLEEMTICPSIQESYEKEIISDTNELKENVSSLVPEQNQQNKASSKHDKDDQHTTYNELRDANTAVTASTNLSPKSDTNTENNREEIFTVSSDTQECDLDREIKNNIIKEESICQVSQSRETVESTSLGINTLSDTRDEISSVKNKKRTQSKLKTNGLSKKLTTKEDDSEKDIGKSNDIEVYERAKIIDDVARQKKQDDTDNQYEVAVSKTLSSLNAEILDNKNFETVMNPTQSIDTKYQTTTSKDVKTTPYTVKEKPQFIDPNFVDTSMGFLRPPTYISKPFEAENFFTPELNTYTSTSNVLYKASSLIGDHQSKSMYTGDREKQLETQLSTKATSESRSIYSEKRASSIRDLKRKPVFTTHLTNRTAVEGSRVKLTCSVLSSTEPVLKWYKNGVLLEDKHKYKIKFTDGLITMELLNALPSDSGDYSCTVDNEHGSITTSAKLKVYPSFESSPIPPTFTRSIRDVYHRAENELILECRIRGQPLPIISWFKDNKPIASYDRYEASYLADGLCRLTISSPSIEDSGTYTCKAESAVWSDQITHVVNFADATRIDSHISSVERLRLSHDTRRPHFTNVLSDYKVIKGGTIGLQVEIGGAPTRVEWLREGSSVTELDKNAQTFVDHGIYTLALNDVSERHSGLYTCRAWSTHGNVDMNAEISVVQPNEIDGKPAVIVSRPTKDVLISVGEDINISFRVQGEPRPKVFFLKGIRDITNSQRVCKMTSDDYVKFTMKRSVISDAGTYCILARNVYGCDRAFVTVVVRQRASSDNLISDWTYPAEDPTIIATERKYKSVPGRIPGEPSAVDGANNWVALVWPKSDPQEAAPVLAYRVDSWLLGKEGGARWIEMGITPRNTFDAFNLKQGEEYHFRVTPRNRYGWGESVQTSTPIAVGIAGDRPEFIDILPGLLKVLVGETANLSCSFKGKPTPVIAWMKNGSEIEESDKVRSRQNGNVCSLTIKNVEIEDEGRYSCEATNAHGRASTYARMTVITDRQIWEADAKLKRERSADATGEYPPQFTMRLRDRRVQATYPVRLTFQVIGSPTPNVTWFKDGQEVTFDSRKTSYKDEHFHTLEIAPTTLDDGGLYEALARNNSGAVSCRCSLVVDKGIRAYVAPEFCCGLEPLYRLNEGDELRISAIVEAYPSVGVTWYRDGVRLRPSRRAIMTLDRDGQIELALASVTPRDAGVYTCTASNEVGQASTAGKVEIVTDQREERRNVPTVICPDIPYSKEPMFIIKPRSTEAQEGDTVIIECEVIGDPTPEVYWLRDFLKPDYYRDAKHFKQMAAGPLYRFEIPHAKLDFTGAYSVVARNVHGEAKAIISLQIFAKDLSSSDETHSIRYGRVEVIPRFEKELTDLLCYDSDAIEFECLISGHPEPDIRWFHYNQLLPDCPDFESTYDLGTARLKIKQVAAEDEGTYTCEASNNLGKATSTACLVVYPPGEPNTISQRLQRPPALASAASTPRSTPRVTPARSVSRTPARSGPESRRLRSPTREVGPKFYTYPFNKVVEEGDGVVLQCAVGGFPTPWATWDKDGIIITPTSRISVKEKDEMLRILQIDEVNVEDVGLYRITLENDFGRAEASARLEVISHKGKFHSRSSSVSPARLYRRRTPSFTRQD